MIPADLKAVPRWLLWKRVVKADGSLVKVPMHPSGGYPASAHAPSTWMSFDEAVRRLRQRPKGWGGVGIAMSADDDLGCVDLDGAVNPDTGVLAGWAQTVLDLFAGAYVEYSPSGKGYHIFARGAPQGLHDSLEMDEQVVPDKEPFLEAFAERQFVTVTGRHVSGDGLPVLADAWAEVVAMLGARPRAQSDKTPVEDADLGEVEHALTFFSSDDVGGRSGFVGIAMALRDAFGEEAFEVWDAWMSRSENDEGTDANRVLWDSLPDTSRTITLRTIFWRARRAGWKPALDFDPFPADLDFDTPQDLDFDTEEF